MSLLKSSAKTTLKCESKINVTGINKIHITQRHKLSRMTSTRNQSTFRIPDLYKEANSGILASNPPEISHVYKFSEFMMPGDALMQKAH